MDIQTSHPWTKSLTKKSKKLPGQRNSWGCQKELAAFKNQHLLHVFAWFLSDSFIKDG